MNKTFSKFCAGKLNSLARHELESLFEKVLNFSELSEEFDEISSLYERLVGLVGPEEPETTLNALVLVINDLFEEFNITEKNLSKGLNGY